MHPTYRWTVVAHGVARHLGILQIEIIIADTAPNTMVLDLQAAFIGSASAFQTVLNGGL